MLERKERENWEVLILATENTKGGEIFICPLLFLATLFSTPLSVSVYVCISVILSFPPCEYFIIVLCYIVITNALTQREQLWLLWLSISNWNPELLRSLQVNVLVILFLIFVLYFCVLFIAVFFFITEFNLVGIPQFLFFVLLLLFNIFFS